MNILANQMFKRQVRGVALVAEPASKAKFEHSANKVSLAQCSAG